MRVPAIEAICTQILADIPNVVVVPNYGLVSTISSTLHRLSGKEACMLPRFFILEDLYKYQHTKAGTPILEASVLEKMVILGSVLKKQGIALSALDEYYHNIEHNKQSAVRDAYIAELKAKNLALPYPLGVAEIKWLVDNFSGKLFIIPTLENIDLPSSPFQRRLESRESYILRDPSLRWDDSLNITLIEHQNKFELTRALASHKWDYVIVESEDIRDLVHKELGLARRNLCDTHEFKLFYAIAKLAFNPSNLDHVIELATNPISSLRTRLSRVAIQAQIKSDTAIAPSWIAAPTARNDESGVPTYSWLRAHGDTRAARSVLASIINTLEPVDKIAKSESYLSALILHNSAFSKLVCEEKCDPHILFELQQFIGELKIYLGENLYKLDSCYLSLLHNLARKRSIATNSSSNIIGLKQADYLDLGNIVLVENGISRLEKVALEEGDKEFENLRTRLSWLLGAPKLTVLRVNDDQESIFYSTLKPLYPPAERKASSYKKNPSPQPYAAVAKELRPKEYSVTALTKLIADPYSYYAEYILNLKRVDRIWETVENRDFGIVAHSVLSNPDDKTAIETALNGYELTDSVQQIWRERLAVALDFIKAYYAQNPVSKYFTECKGTAEIEGVAVTARADRIDISVAGDATIIDIKTGYAPSQTEVDKGIAPQLAIESWILSKQGFPGLPSTTASAKYFAINGRLNGQSVRDIKLDDSLTESSLVTLLESFYTLASPYFATPIAQPASYKHLKRLDEWFESV